MANLGIKHTRNEIQQQEAEDILGETVVAVEIRRLNHQAVWTSMDWVTTREKG